MWCCTQNVLTTWNSVVRKTKQLQNGGKRIIWLVDLPGDVIQVYELGLARLTTEWRPVKGLASILDTSILCTWFHIMASFFTMCYEGKIKFKVYLCPLWKNMTGLRPLLDQESHKYFKCGREGGTPQISWKCGRIIAFLHRSCIYLFIYIYIYNTK